MLQQGKSSEQRNLLLATPVNLPFAGTNGYAGSQKEEREAKNDTFQIPSIWRMFPTINLQVISNDYPLGIFGEESNHWSKC